MSIFTSTPLSTFANVRTMYIPSKYIWDVYGQFVWAEMVSALFAQPAALRVLGLDIEWYNKSPPSTLQLATHTHCFVIQLSLLPDRAVPSEVIRLLSDSRCIKSGVGINDDVKKLVKLYSIDIPSVLMVDKFSKHLGLLQGSKFGLKSLTSAFLNYELEKNFKVTISNWELELTKPQIEYAADDAIASCLLGRCVMREAMARSLFEPPITENASNETNLCVDNQQERQLEEQEFQETLPPLYTWDQPQQLQQCETGHVQCTSTFPPTPSYEEACQSLLINNYNNNIYMTLEPDVMCQSNTNCYSGSNYESKPIHNNNFSKSEQKISYKQRLCRRQQTNEATQEREQEQQPQEEKLLLLLPESSSAYSTSGEMSQAVASTVLLSPEEEAVQHWLATCLHNINVEHKQHKEKRMMKFRKASKMQKRTGESGPVLVVNAEGLPLTYCSYNEAKRFVVLDRIAYVVSDEHTSETSQQTINSISLTVENNNNDNNNVCSDNNTTSIAECVPNTSSKVKHGVHLHDDHRPRIIRLISNDAGKRRLCQLHRLGQCQRGSKCLYAHSVDELIVDHYVDDQCDTDGCDIDVCNEECSNTNVSMQTSKDDNDERGNALETKAIPSLQPNPVYNVVKSVNRNNITSLHVNEAQRELQEQQYHHELENKQAVCQGGSETTTEPMSQSDKFQVEQIREQQIESVVLEPKESSNLSSLQLLLPMTPNQRDGVATESLSSSITTTRNAPLRCVHCYGDINIMPHSIIPPSLQRYLPKKCRQSHSINSTTNNSPKFVPICLSCHRQICAQYDNEMNKMYEEASQLLNREIDIKRITKCYSIAKLLSRQHSHKLLNDKRIEELKQVLLNEWPYSFVHELANDNYSPSVRGIEDIDDELIERIASNAPGKVRCAITMQTLVGDDAKRAETFVEHWVRFAASLKLIDNTTATRHES